MPVNRGSARSRCLDNELDWLGSLTKLERNARFARPINDFLLAVKKQFSISNIYFNISTVKLINL